MTNVLFPDEEQIGEGIMEGAAEVIRDGKAVLGLSLVPPESRQCW